MWITWRFGKNFHGFFHGKRREKVLNFPMPAEEWGVQKEMWGRKEQAAGESGRISTVSFPQPV